MTFDKIRGDKLIVVVLKAEYNYAVFVAYAHMCLI